MNSILRKAMLPAAVAIAMAGFIGAFGSGSVSTVQAVEGDICHVDVDSRAGETHDGQGNDVFVVERGTQYGLVYRLEDDDSDNVTIRIDSETGSARITSKAEILDVTDEQGGDREHVGHILVTPSVGTQVVDTMDPDDEPATGGSDRHFADADGNLVNGINGWLVDVGYPGFAASAEESLCGSSTSDDGWGFIDFECIEHGYFHIDILTPEDTEETGMTLKFFCPGQAETAEIKSQRSSLETDPTGVAPAGFGDSLITVTVFDQSGDRLNGAKVTFTTDNCHFDAGAGIAPAGGGDTVTTVTDTDTSSDDSFLIDNPLQDEAGTAEATLDCTGSDGSAGVANITAIVERPGTDIILKTSLTVVGETTATGLSLTLTPEDFECGETLLATATAVDDLGQPVSDGTKIFFTTDTSSGVVGGEEGAQGGIATDDGSASVLIATDPGNSGIHTVIAFTKDSAGRALAQVSDTYTCEGAVAPAVPTVAAPDTGTGTGSITPPNTGSAGLAAGTTSSASLFLVAGVAFVLAGLASIRFARN